LTYVMPKQKDSDGSSKCAARVSLPHNKRIIIRHARGENK
jgi:hypothetical protein